MSGDDKKNGKGNGSGNERPSEPTLVEPIPGDLELFTFLDGLFAGQQDFPEKIEVRVVRGKDFATMGPMVKQHVWPAGKPKPNREDLVKLSNEFVHLMQRDADVKRKEAVYHVAAIHFSRSPDPYERYLKRMKPGMTYRNGENGDENIDDEDEKQSELEKRHSTQIMRHHEQLFGLYGTALENLIDRQDRVVERTLKRNDQLEERNERLANMLERALDHNAERQDRLEWSKLKTRGAEKLLDMSLAVAPPLLGALIGDKTVKSNGTGDSIEAYTLRTFLKPVSEGGQLTEEQSNAAFGVWTDGSTKQCVKPGVMSPPQVTILVQVALGQMPVSELDKLLPGADYGVTNEQAAALMQVFPMEQLAPLMLLIEKRRNRIKE